ncbi:hypothetical protein DFQ00_111160 [Paenibacillus barcinonensis]|uniref:Uncharacterized protein n=1 Tax=Paenibacillus barcinonensis TaxID=198119 RepID=A0A2V4V7Q6_PAEBA|nr:hypothetical protein DFQ00_111160 [Paenibacillus barcinonensis]
MLYFSKNKILLPTHRLEPIIHLLGDLVAAVGFPVGYELIECINWQFAVDDFVEGFEFGLTEQVPFGYHGWCGCAGEIVLFADVDLGRQERELVGEVFDLVLVTGRLIDRLRHPSRTLWQSRIHRTARSQIRQIIKQVAVVQEIALEYFARFCEIGP